MSIEPMSLAAEMSGYCDVGMKGEALRLARVILKKRRISPQEFGEVVRTIGVFSGFEKWKRQLEATYERQSRKFKREARPFMLEMYGSLGEWENAAQLLSVRKPSSPGEVYFGMEALLKLNKLEEARTLATSCRRVLSVARSPFEQSFLFEALAKFFARTHQWGHAIAAWQHATLNEPFRRDALSCIVKIHLARAFEAAEHGLQQLAELKQNPDNENELILPGNDEGLTRDAEKQLLKFKRGIEKLLPKNVRKELGVITPAR